MELMGIWEYELMGRWEYVVELTASTFTVCIIVFYGMYDCEWNMYGINGNMY